MSAPGLISEAGAPPVVAVVVAYDPGPWLEECLESLQRQEYPNCSILVLDNASAEPLAARVAEVAPNAYLHRLPENRGFGPAANAVLELVENAAFFLFCHDDVMLAADALQKMVEEAFRSNAGIVSPKLLDADDPRRLLQLGLGIDRLGAPVRRVERGELDQAQHDEVREVFAAPGACTLVRADLFSVIGGFDPEVSLFGEDVDLSWRARLVGARIVVEPAAEVLHLELTASRRRSFPETRAYRFRHELRAVLKNYGRLRSLPAVAQLAIITAAEVVYFLLLGNAARARELIACWRWNLAPERRLRSARAEVAGYRRVPDRIVAKLFAGWRSHLGRVLRRHLPERLLGDSWVLQPSPDPLRPPPRFTGGAIPAVPGALPAAPLAGRFGPEASGRSRSSRQARHHVHHERRPAWVVAVAVAVALVLVIGSRAILFGPTPLVGQLLPIPAPSTLLGHFFGGWQDAGLQRPGPATPAFAVLGLAGGVLFGATGLLLVVELAACVVLGAFGVVRLLRPFGPPSIRLAGAIAYLFLPLAWNDLAAGQLQGLVAYAAVPWVLGRLSRATRLAPFAQSGISGHPLWREVLALGAVVALAAAFEPLLLPLSLAMALALGLGGLVAGEARSVGRPLAVAGGGCLVALVLLFPWSLTFFQPGARWSVLSGALTAAARAPALSVLLRFALGPMGHGVLGFGLLAAAAVVLLIGSGPRLAWATRYWVAALALFGLAWAADRGWLGSGGGALVVLLAPAACCLACCVALGAASVAVDLPRSSFGWRHLAGLAGGLCAVAFLFPVLGAAPGGRWGLPSSGYDTVLSWTSQLRAGQGPTNRVLWLGDPAALPLAGWQIRPGLAAAVSTGGLPDASRLWPSPDPGVGDDLIADVASAEAGSTVQLGHQLAEAQIAAVVVPGATAPALGTLQQAAAAPAPSGLRSALGAQLDLHQLPSEGGALVYENTAAQQGSGLPGEVASPGGTPAPLRGLAVGAEIAAWLLAALLLASRRFRRIGLPGRLVPAAAGGAEVALNGAPRSSNGAGHASGRRLEQGDGAAQGSGR